MSHIENYYTSGTYWNTHESYLKDDKPAKARDVIDGFVAAVDKVGTSEIRVADVGGGTGAVIAELARLLKPLRPNVTIKATIFEIAANAVEYGRKAFPQQEYVNAFFQGNEGTFDVLMYIDVLEHVENPWDLLRKARGCSQTLLIRQPLEGTLPMFRHNSYKGQRESLGHINYFNYRQFLDMAASCGWTPLNAKLLAPWEFTLGEATGGSLLRKAIVGWNREMASQLLHGFYLNGSFA